MSRRPFGLWRTLALVALLALCVNVIAAAAFYIYAVSVVLP